MQDKIKKHQANDKQLKRIGVSFGATVAMQDYEFIRVDVWEDAYVTEDEKEQKYAELWESVRSQVRQQIDDVMGVDDEEEEEQPRKKKSKKNSKKKGR